MYSIFSKLMENAGETPYQVAKATGVSQSTLSDWKTGKSVPRNPTMKKIADHFGVSVSYLKGESEQQEKPADQMADGQEETIQIAEKIKKASPKLKKFIIDALEHGAEPSADYVKVKITCPIDGTEQVIYQPVYRIGHMVVPESGNNGCEMCRPCNECTICRLKAVSSLLPDIDPE